MVRITFRLPWFLPVRSDKGYLFLRIADCTHIILHFFYVSPGGLIS